MRSAHTPEPLQAGNEETPALLDGSRRSPVVAAQAFRFLPRRRTVRPHPDNRPRYHTIRHDTMGNSGGGGVGTSLMFSSLKK